MRTLPLLVSVLAVTTAAIPANAQAWRLQPQVQRQIQSDINQLERQIANAQSRRTVSQREATALRRQAVQVQRLYNSSVRGGLTRTEVARLEAETNRVRQQLRLERRDWDGRRG